MLTVLKLKRFFKYRISKEVVGFLEEYLNVAKGTVSLSCWVY